MFSVCPPVRACVQECLLHKCNNHLLLKAPNVCSYFLCRFYTNFRNAPTFVAYNRDAAYDIKCCTLVDIPRLPRPSGISFRNI